MAITKTKTKLVDANGDAIVDGQIYTAIESFAAGEFGHIGVARGTRFRAPCEQIAASPTMWLPDGATDLEVAHARERHWPISGPIG